MEYTTEGYLFCSRRAKGSAPTPLGLSLCYSKSMFRNINNSGKILLEYQRKVYGYQNIDRLCQVLELPIGVFMSYCIGAEPKRSWLVAQVNKFLRLGKPMPILIWADDIFELHLGEVCSGEFEVIERRLVRKSSIRK